MQVEELKAAKDKLEVEIYETVQRSMIEFETRTGKTPDSIYINLENIQQFMEPDVRRLVGIDATVTI